MSTAVDSFDIVVIGAGAAGLTAACVASAEGQRVLLAESSPLVGGTTAISGGMVWIPANRKAAAAGLPDSLDAARRYLGQVVPPQADSTVLETFLARGDEAIAYLEARTSLRLQPVLRYPDYYPDLPGATAGGRVLEPVAFDGRSLGPSFGLLRPPLPEFTIFGGMMVSRSDIPHLRRGLHSPRSAWHTARLLVRHARERLAAPRGTTLVLGNALAGRLFKSVLDLGVTLQLQTSLQQLVGENGRVVGVDLRTPGSTRHVRTLKGVVLASGGLSHDLRLRRAFVPQLAGDVSAMVGNSGARSGASAAQQLGAALSSGDRRQALWVPVSTFTRHDGSSGVYPHTVTDRGKPGLIAVDQLGQRFVNEALSYHEFVLGQLRAGQRAVPAYLLCDARFLWRYGLGCVKPFTVSVERYVKTGYLKRAASIAGLARSLSVPAATLEETVARTNADAARGTDTRFGRGSDIYQRHLGDGDHAPNPCFAAIHKPPFYAVAVRPADLGMAAGLVTDACARVLSAHGAPIEGLYACGNDMQSVMNGAYPGPGITLGPALVFGYLAARHASSSAVG